MIIKGISRIIMMVKQIGALVPVMVRAAAGKEIYCVSREALMFTLLVHDIHGILQPYRYLVMEGSVQLIHVRVRGRRPTGL